MAIEIITKDDLEQFRLSLLSDLKTLMSRPPSQQKKWLRSGEVKKMLNISTGTLHTLRINGTLQHTKIGSVILYSIEDIEKMIESNKSIVSKITSNH